MNSIAQASFNFEPHINASVLSLNIDLAKYGIKSNLDGSPVVMSYETFAAINKASRGDIGDAGLHMANKSPKTQRRFVKAQALKDFDVIIKRGELRKVYDDLVGAGVLRDYTTKESLIQKALGHPDNTSVQAARNILDRKGISWRHLINE